MGRGKARYNKDCERSRQEKEQMKGKYCGGQTAIDLKKKVNWRRQN